MTGAQIYYQQTADFGRDYPALEDTIELDACVVGGGFAGLNAAYGLARRGLSVALLEQRHFGFGASGRNGGFVFGGYSLGEEALVRKLGSSHARDLYRLTQEGVGMIRDHATSGRIDCDYRPSGVLWANWFHDDAMLHQRREFMQREFSVDWTYLPPAELGERLHSARYQGGLLESDAFHFQPFRFARGLARLIEASGGRLHEQSPVLAIGRQGDRWRVRCERGQVLADRVVVCGGGYLEGLLRPAARAMMPIATYVMATEPLGDRLKGLMPEPWAVYDTRFAFDYYRPLADGRLLWGGRIEAFDSDPASIERKLRQDLARVFPELASVGVDYVWSGLMGYTRHQMPQIQPLAEGLWVAQGFGGHGVSTSTVGGELAARAIAEQDEDWRLFEPFGFDRVYGIAGRAAAQLTYWWLQLLDSLKDRGPPGGPRS